MLFALIPEGLITVTQSVTYSRSRSIAIPVRRAVSQLFISHHGCVCTSSLVELEVSRVTITKLNYM